LMNPTIDEPHLAELKMYTNAEILDISNTTPGWRTALEARQLLAIALGLSNDPVIVEIGAFMGRSSLLLAHACKKNRGGTVHCVDPFDCSGDDFSVPHYQALLRQSGERDLLALYKAKLKRHQLEHWVKIHRGKDYEVARQWSLPIDLLFLDADQSPQGAMTAYLAWEPFLKPGGMIVLSNTYDRIYAEGHDGYYRIAIEQVVSPKFSEITHVDGLTIARKEF